MPPLVTAPSSITAGVILCALLDTVPPPQYCGLVLVHCRGAGRDEQLQGQQQPGEGSAVKHSIKPRAGQCVFSAWLCDVHSNLVAACIPLCSAAATHLQQWRCPPFNKQGAFATALCATLCNAATVPAAVHGPSGLQSLCSSAAATSSHGPPSLCAQCLTLLPGSLSRRCSTSTSAALSSSPLASPNTANSRSVTSGLSLMPATLSRSLLKSARVTGRPTWHHNHAAGAGAAWVQRYAIHISSVRVSFSRSCLVRRCIHPGDQAHASPQEAIPQQERVNFVQEAWFQTADCSARRQFPMWLQAEAPPLLQPPPGGRI